ALGWVGFFSPVLAVERVGVTGTRHVSAAEVQERREPVYGVPLSRVGAGRVGELGGGLPGVAEVQSVPRRPAGREEVG
ncbi:cell division protein DivIVA, partial [Micrococcus sp. SIMBA_131]